MVATALGVDGATLVEDVVRAGPAVVVAASARMVTDDGGAAVTDSAEVEESPFTPVPDVHPTANNNKSPHRRPRRLCAGICDSSGVQRHGDSPLTVLLQGVLGAEPDRGGQSRFVRLPSLVPISMRACYPGGFPPVSPTNNRPRWSVTWVWMRKHLADQKLLEYASSRSMTAGRVGRKVIEETARRYPDLSRMQIDPLQGAFLALLVKLIGATRVLEIGTFTGLSSLSMAQALPESGTLICCDLSEEFTNHASRAWEEAGVADRITLLIGPALQTLKDLEGPFDMAFLDADKPNYPAYLEKLTELVRPGGLIVADNTLWSGRVIDPGDQTQATEEIRRFNDLAAASPDLEVVMLPFADGVTLMRRR